MIDEATDQQKYRAGLPPLPAQLRRLPIERGYPVPWFVPKVKGHYDFRIADYRKMAVAVKKKLCWICGQALGAVYTFPIGPMCAINRTTAEPPSHHLCADWAARACPFLIQKEIGRREAGLPEGISDAPGEMSMRQPGVVLLWTTNSFSLFGDGKGGTLVRIGNPIAVAWLREGREATRAEVEESIKSGFPALQSMCRTVSDWQALDQAKQAAMALLPPASGEAA